jgi:hypothetical protein
MVGMLLLRGMLVGVVAGILCFTFLKIAGEPQVDRAIAFETKMDEALAKQKADAALAKGLPAPKEEQEPELVSRAVQAGLGLFTGVAVYSAAFGGMFALAFALLYGRAGNLRPRLLCALVAGLGFVAIYVVPNLKYPANPPSIGNPETIGMRTGLYFAMMAFSLALMIGALLLRRALVVRQGGWNATLGAAAVYVLGVAVVAALLPGVNEVPEGFPADLLWNFRIASLGAQIIMWGTIGLLFGALTERAMGLGAARELRPAAA